MPENWRSKRGFAYDVEVRCGGCLRYVHEVYADSREDGAGEKGRCRDCVTASPIIMQAIEAPVVVVEGEPEEENAPEAEQNALEEAIEVVTETVAEEDAKAIDPVAAKEAEAAYPGAAEEAPDPVAEEEAEG